MAGVDLSKELTLPPEHFGKQVTMQYMFHIAIDCFEKDNLFTEKLIDPIISMVLPIYWGARNASEFFNPMGFIQVHDVDKIIEVCNNLTPDVYYRYLNLIKQNYNLALNYADYPQCVRQAINRALKL